LDSLNKKYEQFQLSKELRDHLLRLSKVESPFSKHTKEIIIETVLDNNGRSQVIAKETKNG
jgi:hypothetical protein